MVAARIYDMAFSLLPGMTIPVASAVLDRIGSAEQFFTLPFCELKEALRGSAGAIVNDCRAPALDMARREACFVSDKKIKTVFFTDSDYPSRLSMCVDAPLMLYSTGNTEILSGRHMVAVVGTRRATAYGIDFTLSLIRDLAEMLERPVIVSGLAYGIDAAAHRAALDAGVPTVAVVAHGLNTIYPAEHRSLAASICHSGGGLVTEYTSQQRIHRSSFLARNRIVAALCDVTVVVESDSHGGALVTARIAGEYGRQVCAVPGRANDRFSQGCNKLIYTNSASMIRGAEDVVDLMNWQAETKSAIPQFNFDIIEPEFQEIIDHLRKNPSHTAADMSHALGLSMPVITPRLMQMEMEDLITANPGGSFTLKV